MNTATIKFILSKDPESFWEYIKSDFKKSMDNYSILYSNRFSNMETEYIIKIYFNINDFKSNRLHRYLYENSIGKIQSDTFKKYPDERYFEIGCDQLIDPSYIPHGKVLGSSRALSCMAQTTRLLNELGIESIWCTKGAITHLEYRNIDTG